MVREDIVAGLKNAVEKGEPIEKAKQSFISAGYPREEVEAASNLIHSGALFVINRGELPPLKIKEQETQQGIRQEEIPQATRPLRISKPPNFRKNFKIILLLIILLVLVGVLIATIIFREKILAFLS